MTKNTGRKGYIAEEALRAYFRSTGYFVVRGIPLVYRKFDITDVDLWLYVRTTSLSRERTCVDIKSRKTPQAMERVLWTRGLKEVLRLDQAIVVTTDNRPETRDFCAAHGVGILQGEFLQRVIGGYSTSERLTEEDFFALLKSPCVVDSGIEWKAWFRQMKAMLLQSLNFDGCNSFLLGSNLLLDEYLATGKSSEIPVRLLYAIVSYLLIALDYTARSFVALDIQGRVKIITDGLRYGEAGKQRTEEVVQMALQFLADAGKTDLFPGDTLRSEFDRQVSDYRSEILGQHFGKAEPLKGLFNTARAFEESAYAQILQRPHELPSEQKAILALLCDLLRKDRKEII